MHYLIKNLSLENFKIRVSELTSNKNELEIQIATLRAKVTEKQLKQKHQ
jgi:hypothetical protein